MVKSTDGDMNDVLKMSKENEAGWCKRNLFHVALFLAAAAAVVGTLLGSLGSCNDGFENVTKPRQVPVTRNVTRNVSVDVIRHLVTNESKTVSKVVNLTRIVNKTVGVNYTAVTPLTAMVLLDKSGSMGWTYVNDDAGNTVTLQPAGTTRNDKAQEALPVLMNALYEGMNDCSTNAAICVNTPCCKDSEFPCPPGATGFDIVCSSISGTRCCSDKFNQAGGIDEDTKGNTALFSSGSGSVSTASAPLTPDEKLRLGFVRWGSQGDVTTLQSLWRDVSPSLQANAGMSSPSGGTQWGQALCECYKRIKNDAISQATSAQKLCVLVCDGTHSGDSTTYYSNDAYCDTLINDRGGTSVTNNEIEQYVKDQGYTIYGILVAMPSNTGYQMYRASSCPATPAGYHKNLASAGGWNANDIAKAAECANYLHLQDPAALKDKAAGIASALKAAATATTTVTSSSSESVTELTSIDEVIRTAVNVSITDEVTSEETHAETKMTTELEYVEKGVTICSDAYLFALLAFLPLLAYIISKPFVIIAAKNRLKTQLLSMIDSGEIDRQGHGKGHTAKLATQYLLPHQRKNDIDFRISYGMFTLCPCLLPVSETELDNQLAKTTETSTVML